jgi:hypothetical protein
VAKHRVIVGMHYVPEGAEKEVRAEPGDIVEDIPDRSVKWMLRQGFIEEARERAPSKKAQATKEIRAAVKEADQPAEIPEKLEDLREGED